MRVTLRGPGSRALTCLGAMVAVVLPLGAASGCSDCEAKCLQSSALITVTNEVAGVEVCDDNAVCTRQAFGGRAEPNVLARSFQISAPNNDGVVHLNVRVFPYDESEIPERSATAEVSSGDCGCDGPARFFVSLDGVNGQTSG